MKYVIIIVILVAIVGGGVLAYQNWWLPKQEPKEEEPEEPYIEVTSPNGGEQWVLGESYDVQWLSNGIKNVNILLTDYRAPETCYLNQDFKCEGGKDTGVTGCEIIPVDATEGSFHIDNLSQVRCRPGMMQFPVSDISPGGQYKIKIADADNPSIADFSDNYFIIIEKEESYIKVLTPKGGEQLEKGQTYEIRWESTEDINNVRISLNNKIISAYEYEIAKSSPNNGIFKWVIPQDLLIPASDAYVVRIMGCHYSEQLKMDVCGALGDPIAESGFFSIVGE